MASIQHSKIITNYSCYPNHKFSGEGSYFIETNVQFIEIYFVEGFFRTGNY